MFAAAISKAVFKLCHGKNLVYNTCWEDPRLDRVALELGPGDRLLVITSAGCNALDYALDEPERIDTVDVNPRQNALLELKQVAIRQLDYETFFELFGRGRLAGWREIYQAKIQPHLSPAARKFWDKKYKFFSGKGRRPSFYFRGSSGFFAWSINGYVNRIAKIRPQVDRLLAATSLDEQREVYEREVKPVFWGPGIQWFLKRDSTLSLLGVPRAQRTQLERYYPGGITKFIEDRLDWLFTKVPIHDNYFWRVYMTGEYTRECCPDYLKEENFNRLKSGLVDRIHTHTTTLLDHLTSTRRNYSHCVLLDHMDWLAEHHHDILERQWQAIVDHADPEARILWRSAALKVEFVDPIRVTAGGEEHRLGDLLEYNDELAAELNTRDRVNTYASFAITTLHKPNEAALAAHHDERTGTTQDSLPSGPVAHSG
jgi:S-adenosylmethionine-diacylglycerol 3-amino-3-carboxypropyl transferase